LAFFPNKTVSGVREHFRERGGSINLILTTPLKNGVVNPGLVKSSIKMKVVLILFAILSVSYKCENSSRSSVKEYMRAVRITGNLPAITSDTSFVISNSYDIFYFGNLITYKFKYRFDSFYNGQSVLQIWRPNYLVFHKDSIYGYSYYPHESPTMTNGRISIDTMFKRNAYQPFRFDSVFHDKPDSSYFDENKSLVKVYDVGPSQRFPEKFVYYLYYSKKFYGITEGFFSKSMDDEKGMKLFKIRAVAQGHYYDEYKFFLPKREFLYEMTEIPIENKAEILSYFERYKKDAQRIN